LTSAFFRNIDTFLEEQSCAILVEKDGALIGFAIMLLDDSKAVPLFCGLDYEYNRVYCTYFNLVYKLVETAIERGVATIDMGITNLASKKDVGAYVVPVHMYMKRLGRWLTPALAAAWNAMTPVDDSGSRRVFRRDGQQGGDHC
jgi:hypothetical protein